MAARLAEIRPFLDERAWRLLLGAEARAIGYGGMKLVAGAAKVKADTVSRGARELESGVVPDGRVRAPGAGRPERAGGRPRPGAGVGGAGRSGHAGGSGVGVAVDDEVDVASGR